MLKPATDIFKRGLIKLRREYGMRYGDVFTAPEELALYRQVVAAPRSSDPPVTFHPKCLDGAPLLCRPGASDKHALEDLLFLQVYLPPPLKRTPRTIVDLGANVGYTLAHFAHLYPDARIVGLELDIGNHALALANTAQWRDRVTVLHAAIWSSDGHVTFGGHDENEFHVITGDAISEGRRVRSLTVPTLMNEAGFETIDYVKMDIEGGETELILNSDTSWMDKVGAMKIELHDVDHRDFERALKARGFRCYEDPLLWKGLVAVRD
jgi:FkbM family methyltransferase